MTDLATQLSGEIITEVLSLLDLRSFLNACTTCKHWNSWNSVDYIWKKLYHREFKPQTLYRADQYSSWQDQFKKHYSYKRWQKSEENLTLSDEVWTVKFSPNGKYLAYGGKCGELVICEIDYKPDEQLIELIVIQKFLTAKTFGIGQLSWSPDSSKLLVTYKNQKFGVVDVRTQIYTPLGSCSSDTHAHFLSNDYIVSTSESNYFDDKIQEMIHKDLIDLTNLEGKLERRMEAKFCERSLSGGALCDAKQYLIYDYYVSLGFEKIYKVYLFPTAKLVDPLAHRYIYKDDFLEIEEYGEIYGFCTSDADKQLFVISKNLRSDRRNGKADLRLWDIETKSVVRTWSVGETDQRFFSYPSMTRDDQIVLLGDYNGNVYIIHKEANEVLHQFKAHDAIVNYATMHPTLDLLATASDTGELGLWTPTSSKLKVKVNLNGFVLESFKLS